MGGIFKQARGIHVDPYPVPCGLPSEFGLKLWCEFNSDGH
jgi:hypothetical protein